jgi:hypothetical protein
MSEPRQGEIVWSRILSVGIVVLLLSVCVATSEVLSTTVGERPNDKEIRLALEQSLSNFSQARTEIEALHVTGRLLRGHPPRFSAGFWSDSFEQSNALFYANFGPEGGPIRFLQKTVYTDKGYTEELRKLGYSMSFATNGQIEQYSSRNDKESLGFDSSGTLINFRSEFDSTTTCYATWGSDGKLKSERVATHSPSKDK